MFALIYNVGSDCFLIGIFSFGQTVWKMSLNPVLQCRHVCQQDKTRHICFKLFEDFYDDKECFSLGKNCCKECLIRSDCWWRCALWNRCCVPSSKLLPDRNICSDLSAIWLLSWWKSNPPAGVFLSCFDAFLPLALKGLNKEASRDFGGGGGGGGSGTLNICSWF